jgi:hypothetical protein
VHRERKGKTYAFETWSRARIHAEVEGIEGRVVFLNIRAVEVSIDAGQRGEKRWEA